LIALLVSLAIVAGATGVGSGLSTIFNNVKAGF